MRISLAPLRPLVYLAIAAGLLAAVIDAGAVMLTRFRVPEDLRLVGQAAAVAVEDLPVNADTAHTAFEVAAQEARPLGMVLEHQTFTLYPDGRVSLTGTRTAPTLLLERFDALRPMATVTSTTTISASPYS